MVCRNEIDHIKINPRQALKSARHVGCYERLCPSCDGQSVEDVIHLHYCVLKYFFKYCTGHVYAQNLSDSIFFAECQSYRTSHNYLSRHSTSGGGLLHTLHFAFPPSPSLYLCYMLLPIDTVYCSCCHSYYVLIFHVHTWGSDHLDNSLSHMIPHFACTGQVPSPCSTCFTQGLVCGGLRVIIDLIQGLPILTNSTFT